MSVAAASRWAQCTLSGLPSSSSVTIYCLQADGEALTQGGAAVQASTNTLLSHFVSLLSSLWILLQISQKPPVPPESLGAVPARA